MPKTKLIPITGTVLRWAIAEAGFTEEELASRLKVDPGTVRRWETGPETPNTTQFRGLVQALRRPSAIFFLPEPPQRTSIQAQFRGAPGVAQRALKPEEARWLRKARWLQQTASWLVQELGEEPPDMSSWRTTHDVEATAITERSKLGISVSVQRGWLDASTALKQWRTRLESLGILVFQLRLGRESCRGFSLWDDLAPVIAINSAYNEAARIYTLFHEYSHLLLRTDAICVAPFRWVGPGQDEDPERWCERFAAALLLPRGDLLDYLALAFGWRYGTFIRAFDQVINIARHYKVSLRAAALRLVELGAAEYSLYQEVNERAQVAETEKRGGGGRGLQRHEVRVQELGKRLPRILLDGLNKDILGLHDVLENIDVSTSHLADLESLVTSD